MHDLPPPDIPDFNLIRRIGAGSFSEVWLARNRATGALRALKLIPLRRAGQADPAGREIASLIRFEANVHVRHPNLLAVHHVGRTADHLFFVMDPADDASGRPASDEAGYQPATLDRRLAEGPLPADECLRCARQLLEGLACLHDSGMIHRDVKPANCLFIGGSVKLADFGLLTEAGRQISCLGTLTYMPPDGRMDARADVYAAGLVLYEMITGEPADRFPRLGREARRVAESPILAGLNRVALEAGDPDPERRFRDARQMCEAVAAVEREAASPAGPSRRPPRRAILAAGAAVLLAGGTWALWPVRPPRVDVNFITEPFEATIHLDGRQLVQPGGAPYRTPCTVPQLDARVCRVTFKREGRPDLDAGELDFARVREIRARWGP
jgi:serine/threonine protein kinase